MARRRRRRRERARLAPARSLAEPERGPLTRRAAGAALPRRRVRADRREGHDRVHDPRGHRPLEAVAARLLPVLRRQGRAAPRAVRGDHPRVDRRPPRRVVEPSPTRSSGSARSRSGCTSGATRRRRRASAATHNRRPISEFSVQLAVDHPDRVKAAMAPDLADDARARRRRERRRRDRRGRHAARGRAHAADGDVQLVRQPPRRERRGCASRPRRPGSSASTASAR